MGCTAFDVVAARFVETQLAVDREAHFRGVVIFLAVIFPPADGAKLESSGRFESFVSTTRATITYSDCGTHVGIDGKRGRRVT